MYKKSTDQMSFVNFHLPFDGKLNPQNRWVKKAQLIPWREFEETYARHFSSKGPGAPAKTVRIALGALIIKEKLGTSDEETIEQIRENPYLQYFLGLPEYQNATPFDPSMFVYFRKRLDRQTLARINERIAQLATQKANTSPAPEEHDDESDSDKPSHKGKLIIDATCAPSDISFPTDLNLLNDAREKLEELIDTFHAVRQPGQKKPRTYRWQARKEYLRYARCRKLSASKRRKGLRKQLGYVHRNLEHIEQLVKEVTLLPLSAKQYQNLLVVGELYRQQEEMYASRSNRIDDRIVSIAQPYIRPIVRGKLKSPVEFGAKISASVVEGFIYLDHVSWDAYNEAGDLFDQVESFKSRTGCYPVSIHADKIYRNRENLAYCRKLGIRLSGPVLGRPPKALTEDPAALKAHRKEQHQDEIDRIEIEGKFGIAKRHYSLGRIMTKLASTSESAIALIFLVMNLKKWLTGIFLSLFQKWLFFEIKDRFYPAFLAFERC